MPSAAVVIDALRVNFMKSSTSGIVLSLTLGFQYWCLSYLAIQKYTKISSYYEIYLEKISSTCFIPFSRHGGFYANLGSVQMLRRRVPSNKYQ